MLQRWMMSTAAIFMVVIGIPLSVTAADTDIFEMTLEELMQVKIEIASKRPEPISSAPAVATVITAEDIKAMGATTLDEVLQTVAGIHVLRSVVFYTPIYSIRGIHQQLSTAELLMINGIPLRGLLQGRHQIRRDLPINMISSIEIIRGPGSALHGADAISGVININTKSYRDLERTEAGARIGTYKTRDAWLGTRGQFKGFQSAFTLDYHESEGFGKTVASDIQTEFDTLFASNATLSPGPTENEAHALDIGFDIEKGKWRFRTGYQRLWDYGAGIGTTQSLDPVSRSNGEIYMADLYYQNASVTEHFGVSALMRYDQQTTLIEPAFLLSPPGATFPTGSFPEGVIGGPESSEWNTQFEFSTLYTGFIHHNLRLGTGFLYSDLYKTKDKTNFTIDETTLLPTPRGALIDVPKDQLFVTERIRKSFFVYLQDQWHISDNWQLTLGMRHDHDADFGETNNPRAALVWQTTPDFTTKLLYGEAFRAPTFAEAYLQNNPAVLGNPNINPEKIATTEIAFDLRVTPKLHLGLNTFYYKWRDVIQYGPNPTGGPGVIAQNAGTQTGRGFELEWRWRPKSHLNILGNFAHQNARNKTRGETLPDAPQYQTYLRIDWNITGAWYLSPQLTWNGKRPRASNDPRPELDDIWLTDVTLRRKHHAKSWEFALLIRNLFNHSTRQPSPGPSIGSTLISLPDDLPGPDRRIFGEIRYLF